jgi:hypothetical protein
MTIPRTSTSRTSSFAALLALACALVIAAAQTQATAATENAVLRPLADESPSLPVTTTFEKSADADSGPYVLKVLSVAKDTLVVNAKIVASVVSHGDTKERNLPAHTLEVGQTWSITGLAATDKVTLTAKGYASVELTVP